ncbi:integral membrane protein [Streptococcus pneumoniae]|nr:integral membrane protein [Streptococcus pneumoniae]VQL62746.1 integral membrane protein [Streptococcus pneumoniae]VRU17621.1 integral membrane protein [Streptococcus pneumoniae]
MKQTKTTKIALVSLLTALSVVLGYFLKIPTPTGILTLLDAGVFFAAFYFGSREGAVVGGLASFLIDLLSGYPQWMFFSLVNHGLQGFFAGFKGKSQWLGLILATIAMVGGYALGSTLMNGWAAALPEILPNFMQNMVGMIVGFILSQSIKKINPNHSYLSQLDVTYKTPDLMSHFLPPHEVSFTFCCSSIVFPR